MGLGFSSISNSYVVYGTLCVGFGSTQLGFSLAVKVTVLVLFLIGKKLHYSPSSTKRS